MSILNYLKKRPCRNELRSLRGSKYAIPMRKLHETGLPLLALLLLAAPAVADVVRAATIRVAPIYLSPDTSSAKLADVDRGRELIFLETSGDWVKVEAN